MPNHKYTLMFLVGLLLTNQVLFSQIILQGTISDNGAEYLGYGAEPVVGAMVTLTDQTDTSRSYSAYTDAQGNYAIEISHTAVEKKPQIGPETFQLFQNYPNPFNPSTVIDFQLNQPAHVTLTIYNVLGQKVKTLLDGNQYASGRVIWHGIDEHGQGVPAGVYIYVMKATGGCINRKMLLLDGHHGCIASGSPTHAMARTGAIVVQKQLSEQYTLKVTGKNITAYDKQNLTVDSDMTLNITVTRTVTDIDGHVYPTVKAGNQWWMAENLRVTRYTNGDTIPEVLDDLEWAHLKTGARCSYDNDEGNAETYGYLYNWFAVDDSRNIAPAGWHVPTDDEWKKLEMVLGMSQEETGKEQYRGSNEGSKLAGNSDLWYSGGLENNAAFGESGLCALPAGYRYDIYGCFYRLRYCAGFWSSTQWASCCGWYRDVHSGESLICRDSRGKSQGFSVRLVRD